MQKTENSYLWPSRFESNPQSYGNKKHATLPMLPIVTRLLCGKFENMTRMSFRENESHGLKWSYACNAQSIYNEEKA